MFLTATETFVSALPFQEPVLRASDLETLGPDNVCAGLYAYLESRLQVR